MNYMHCSIGYVSYATYVYTIYIIYSMLRLLLYMCCPCKYIILYYISVGRIDPYVQYSTQIIRWKFRTRGFILLKDSLNSKNNYISVYYISYSIKYFISYSTRYSVRKFFGSLEGILQGIL